VGGAMGGNQQGGADEGEAGCLHDGWGVKRKL